MISFFPTLAVRSSSASCWGRGASSGSEPTKAPKEGPVLSLSEKVVPEERGEGLEGCDGRSLRAVAKVRVVVGVWEERERRQGRQM